MRHHASETFRWGVLDGQIAEMPDGTSERWIETLCPSPWDTVSTYGDESPAYVARWIGSIPLTQVEEVSGYVLDRRIGQLDEAGLPMFMAVER